MPLSHDRSIRVLVVDDHFFTRIGLSAALNLEADIGVVAEAACGREAIDLYHQVKPDVAILDGHLPDMHGTEVAKHILSRCEHARLLLFSVDETEEDIHRAVSAGVSGYLPKSAPRPQVLSGVRALAAGRRFFPEPIREKIQQRRSHATLSEREIEVVSGMARGLSNKLIASELGVSAETVKTFVARILEKLGVEDRTQAVIAAMNRGLLKGK
jgi:two-component system NarL family response regulator